MNIFQQIDEKIYLYLTQVANEKKITEKDKQKMLQICRVTLENTFNGRNFSEKNFCDLTEIFNYKDVKAYISLYKQGKLRACYSGGEPEDTLLTKLIKGTLNAMEDKRFGGKLKQSELEQIYIDITLMLNPKKYQGKTLQELKNHIQLGCHSIQVSLNGKQAFFKSSVPIKKQYDFNKTFERLARKAGLEKNDYNNPDCLVTIYDTIQFIEDFDSRFNKNAVIDLYRGNKIVYQSPINRFTLEQSLRMAGEYMLRHTTKKGEISYTYHPYEDSRKFSKAPVAVLRCLASIWILAELANYFSESKWRESAKLSLSYLIQQFYFYEEESDFGYLKIDDGANIGSAAFLLLSLTAINDDQFYSEVRKNVAKFIISMVDTEKGFLYPVYLPSKETSFDSKQLYYPGEALTALMTLYQKELYYPYVQVAENVFPYYLSLFRKADARINMAAWISKAYAKVFAATGKSCYSDFLFEVNDHVLAHQQGLNTLYVDRIGCFSNSGNSSAAGVFIESLAEGLSVAKYVQDTERVKRYSEAIWLGMRYIQQMQYHPQECKPFLYRDLIIGGVRTSLFDAEVRIDNVQHCSCAMLKALQLLDCYY